MRSACSPKRPRSLLTVWLVCPTCLLALPTCLTNDPPFRDGFGTSGFGSLTPRIRRVWRRLISAAPPAIPAAAAPAARAGPLAALTARETRCLAPSDASGAVTGSDAGAALRLALGRRVPDRVSLALPARDPPGVEREAALVAFAFVARPALPRLCPPRVPPLLDALPPVLAMAIFSPRGSYCPATHADER